MSEIEFLKEHFSYDPETGVFTWIKTRMRPYLGRPAGSLSNQSGYIVLTINNKHYQAHRAAWAFVYGEWPADDIDHINRVRTDNRICNLRSCTRGQNRLNTHRPEKSNTGIKGVSYNPVYRKKPWRARVIVNFQKVLDKSYATAEEANAAAIEARNRFHGEFARHS